MFDLAVQEMQAVSAQDWEGAVRLARKQEALYKELEEDELNNPLEPLPNDVSEPAVEEIPIEDDDEDEKEVLECSNCDFITTRPSSLTKHTNTFIKCSVCSKLFCGKYAKIHLKSHQKTHDFKPKNAVICQHCKKPFQCNSRLKEHQLHSKCGRL